MSRVYLSPPDVGAEERRLLLEAFDSNWIAPLGPHVNAFESMMCDVVTTTHAAALSSGTAALHLALVLSGVERGDKVLCSSFTFAASANAIAYCGAEPVFIDSERQSWNIDPDLLEEALRQMSRQGGLPRALIAVDLYGQCADYDRIEALCAEYEVPLLEDAAEALGASYRGKPAGSFGRMSVLSFNGNKIITTSGGGMLLSNDAGLVKRARFLATQARDDAPHYQHSTIGYNYRMSNVLAALGMAQLQSLPKRVDTRRRIFKRYQEELGGLEGVQFMPESPGSRSNRWLTCLTVDPGRSGATREDVRVALESENIESRPLWKPMHLQPVFSRCRMYGGIVSEELFGKGLCLPSGSSLSDESQGRVIDVVRQVLEGRRI